MVIGIIGRAGRNSAQTIPQAPAKAASQSPPERTALYGREDTDITKEFVQYS